MWRERSCTSPNDAWYLDSRAVSALRRSAQVPIHRHLSGSPFTQVDSEVDHSTKAGAVMGQMNRAIAREEDDRRRQDRFASTIVIAASIIAAVRLARDDIGRPSPRLSSVIADSVQLARAILERVVR